MMTYYFVDVLRESDGTYRVVSSCLLLAGPQESPLKNTTHPRGAQGTKLQAAIPAEPLASGHYFLSSQARAQLPASCASPSGNRNQGLHGPPTATQPRRSLQPPEPRQHRLSQAATSHGGPGGEWPTELQATYASASIRGCSEPLPRPQGTRGPPVVTSATGQ
ncbi:hypothetical protein H1C71_042251 [Ictidomys tridecemlineatus]|nr:hypothetical protein H1C71_042251 [Ictidomys tridecemlineatus]